MRCAVMETRITLSAQSLVPASLLSAEHGHDPVPAGRQDPCPMWTGPDVDTREKRNAAAGGRGWGSIVVRRTLLFVVGLLVVGGGARKFTHFLGI